MIKIVGCSDLIVCVAMWLLSLWHFFSQGENTVSRVKSWCIEKISLDVIKKN